MTNQQLPPERYGSRARTGRSRPAVRWPLIGLVLVVLVGVAVIGYQNLGSAPIQGEQVAYRVLDDRTVQVTVEVQREDPAKPADCVVRARAQSGLEVGRREVLIHPGESVVRQDTEVRTSERAVMGEVYGCTYNVPEYLSTPTRPTG